MIWNAMIVDVTTSITTCINTTTQRIRDTYVYRLSFTSRWIPCNESNAMCNVQDAVDWCDPLQSSTHLMLYCKQKMFLNHFFSCYLGCWCVWWGFKCKIRTRIENYSLSFCRYWIIRRNFIRLLQFCNRYNDYHTIWMVIMTCNSTITNSYTFAPKICAENLNYILRIISFNP